MSTNIIDLTLFEMRMMNLFIVNYGNTYMESLNLLLISKDDHPLINQQLLTYFIIIN